MVAFVIRWLVCLLTIGLLAGLGARAFGAHGVFPPASACCAAEHECGGDHPHDHEAPLPCDCPSDDPHHQHHHHHGACCGLSALWAIETQDRLPEVWFRESRLPERPASDALPEDPVLATEKPPLI